MSNNKQLLLPKANIVGEKPFDGDLLDRKKLGLKLEKLISRLKEGAVLAIDSPWGEGKTWFGKNWAAFLKGSEYTVIYLDAFENDYMEDPFLLIVAEISNAFPSTLPAEAFKKTAVEVMGALMPLTAKILLNIGGKIVLGTSDIEGVAKELVEKSVEDAQEEAKEWFKSRIDNHAHEKRTVENFKEELKNLAGASDKPLVLIIDELDRCKPLFAVHLIERLKHFFDVPNLVFVLLMNRRQMENAVNAVYGANTDASNYLSKFINFNFHLPKLFSYDVIHNDQVNIYIDENYKKYDFADVNDHQGFKRVLGVMCKKLNLSLRDIERAIALFAYAQPIAFGSFFMAYFIALKIAEPKIFRKIAVDDLMGHSEAKVIVTEIISETENSRQGVPHGIEAILELHNAHLSHFGYLEEKFEQIIQSYYLHYNIAPEKLSTFLTSRIDLNFD